MADALQSLDYMNVHHGYGPKGMLVGTVSGVLSSAALGTLYGKLRSKHPTLANWLPAIFGVVGKSAAIATFYATRNSYGGPMINTAVALNDMGQAGFNAIGLDLGVKLGLHLDKKQLVVLDESTALPAGGVRIAGELPPADPNRSLEDISVEDLANLK